MALPPRNQNSTIAEHLADHNTLHDVHNGWELDWGVQYVHPDGSDSANGFSPAKPKATIEAAYGDVHADGGTIVLAHGRHDIGTGLDLDRRKNVCIKGIGKAKRNRGSASDPTHNALIYSSVNTTQMVNTTTPNATSINAYGFEFRDLDFEIPPVAGVTVFEAPATNQTIVDNCGFYHSYADNTQAKFTIINAHHTGDVQGDDSSWWRVTNNYSRGGQLVHGVGHGLNQWVIRDNVCFGQNLTDPFIYLEKGHRHVVRDNNLEGTNPSCGVYLKEINASSVANSGEATTVYTILDASHGNLVEDMGRIAPSVPSVVVRLLGSSGNNIIICSVVTQLGNLYTQGIDDQTGNADNTFILPSSNKTRNVIQMPGLRIAGVELAGAVRGKAGDLGIKATSADPPFLYWKTSDDGGLNGWRKAALGATDSGGTGFKVVIGPNSVA